MELTKVFFVSLGLFLFGSALSVFISYMKCSKVSLSISAVEGLTWMILPTLCFGLSLWSETVRDSFSIPLKNWFGLEENYSHIVGISYFMMLGSWISTTRMLHTTESEVCKPDLAELKKFEDDLEKELKEKESKNNGGDSLQTSETSS
jgi:hypothetical protein